MFSYRNTKNGSKATCKHMRSWLHHTASNTEESPSPSEVTTCIQLYSSVSSTLCSFCHFVTSHYTFIIKKKIHTHTTDFFLTAKLYAGSRGYFINGNSVSHVVSA